MKKIALVLMPMMALLLVACGEGGDATANIAQPSFAPEAEGGPHAEFMKDMEGRMKALDENIAGMDKRIGSAPNEVKGDLYQMSGELKIRFSNFRVQLFNFLNNPDASQDAQDAIETSWQDLEHAFDEASSKVDASQG